MKSHHPFRLLALVLLASPFLSARAQDLQEQLKDQNVAGRWIYNDWDSARAAALTEKKPIFVLFR